MGTDCSDTQLVFEGFAGRQVVGEFDGGAMTSNGGAPLLREADRAIGLTGMVARCFRDERNPAFVVHSIETLVAQRIQATRWATRTSTTTTICATIRRWGCCPTRSRPSAPTWPRWPASRRSIVWSTAPERASRYRKISVDEAAMEQVFFDLYVAAHGEPPERIILDLDATDDPLHGSQEGRFFHGYYRSYCYLPLYVFDGRHLLVAKLRANIDASAGAKEELARIVAHLRKAWPNVEIWVRADSGFARDELMTWCEENRVEYVFGLARNKRLEPMIGDELAEAKAEFDETGKAARVFKELTYRTLDSWSREPPRGRQGRASGEGRQPALHRHLAHGLRDRRPGALRAHLLSARRDGEPHQGVPARSLCRPHHGGHPARQPAAPVVRLARLRADRGGASSRSSGYPARQRHGRLDPAEASQARRHRHGQRAPHQDRHRLGLPRQGSVRARASTAAKQRRPSRLRRRRGLRPPALSPSLNHRRKQPRHLKPPLNPATTPHAHLTPRSACTRQIVALDETERCCEKCGLGGPERVGVSVILSGYLSH